MPASSSLPPTVTESIVFDTSVLVDDLRTGRHQERIQSISGFFRTSSVVLAELWRGATRPTEQQLLRALEKNHPVLALTQKIWLESGQLLAKMNAQRGPTPDKLRNLHFDILVALTARSYGMTNLEIWQLPQFAFNTQYSRLGTHCSLLTAHSLPSWAAIDFLLCCWSQWLASCSIAAIWARVSLVRTKGASVLLASSPFRRATTIQK